MENKETLLQIIIFTETEDDVAQLYEFLEGYPRQAVVSIPISHDNKEVIK